MTEPTYESGRYVLTEDPDDWPEGIEQLLAHISDLRDAGYTFATFDDGGYHHEDPISFEFSREATPDEVGAEAEKAAAGRVADLKRAKEKERRTYERLKTKFGGE